jgi:hypothetical protein
VLLWEAISTLEMKSLIPTALVVGITKLPWHRLNHGTKSIAFAKKLKNLSISEREIQRCDRMDQFRQNYDRHHMIWVLWIEEKWHPQFRQNSGFWLSDKSPPVQYSTLLVTSLTCLRFIRHNAPVSIDSIPCSIDWRSALKSVDLTAENQLRTYTGLDWPQSFNF